MKKKKINYNYITQIMNHEKKFSDSKKRMVREKFFNKLSEKLGKENEQIQKEREVLKKSKRNCKGFMI